MFTGIVSEVGRVKNITRKASGISLEVEYTQSLNDLKIGDSVAVNGVCLSITKKNKSLIFDVVNNTLKNTNLKRLKRGDKINLESALKVGEALNGHMVSGHVDGERIVKRNQKTQKGWILDIALLKGDEKYIISKGSVAIDGVSLTVGELSNGFFRIFLIPQTLDGTTLNKKRRGDYINIEFDMMGKYAEKAKEKHPITKEQLAEKGFM